MRVLFLDLDGVLYPVPELGAPPRVSEEAVRTVNDACELTGAFIVVTSSWRKRMSLRELQLRLRADGVTAPVVGVTDVVEGVVFPRGEEVAAYIRDHFVESCVVLDDAGASLGRMRQHTVETDHRQGLRASQLLDLLRVLACPLALLPVPVGVRFVFVHPRTRAWASVAKDMPVMPTCELLPGQSWQSVVPEGVTPRPSWSAVWVCPADARVVVVGTVDVLPDSLSWHPPEAWAAATQDRRGVAWVSAFLRMMDGAG